MFQDNRTKIQSAVRSKMNQYQQTRGKNNDRIHEVYLNWSLYSRYPNAEEVEAHLDTLTMPKTFYRLETELLKTKDKGEDEKYAV